MILTEERIQELAPAAFSNEHNMTDRYRQVGTMDVVRSLASQGYYPVDAKQDGATKRDPRFVTHKVVLRHEDHLANLAKVGDQVPQIVIINSHNGRNKLALLGGIFRFVCENGLVVGENMMSYKARHTGNVIQEAFDFTKLLGERMPVIEQAIDRWSQIQLTDGRAQMFARRAIDLRWGDINTYMPEALLQTRRPEDEKRDLWTIFNVVQENCVRGGVQGVSANGRAVRSGGLNSIGLNAWFNRDLWAVAEEFAEMA